MSAIPTISHFPAESQWVWPTCCGSTPNQYLEIHQTFTCRQPHSAQLMIAADSRYALWINGHYIGRGPFPSWPETLCIDTWPLEKFLQDGENQLTLRLHWIGTNTASYVPGSPGVVYAIFSGDQVLAVSGQKSEWTQTTGYQTDRVPRITPQLGFAFAYNAQLENHKKWVFFTKEDCTPIGQLGRTFRPRPLSFSKLGERIPSEIITQGFFKKDTASDCTFLAERMQRDWLSSRPRSEIFPAQDDLHSLTVSPPTAGTDGIYWIIDFGEDVYGLLELEITTSDPVLFEIAYGEHLDDLRVRSHVGQRFFAVSYQSKSGHQYFLEPITPLGGRYLQIHASGFSKPFQLHHIGLRPLQYPATPRGSLRSNDAMTQRIYDTCVRTLQLCMGEHYFDTPWREQALYANDLLNQSLAGYYVFGDYRYPQVSLDLLGGGLREDGFLEICAPARLPITIPAFTFAWVVAVEKNLLYSGDLTFVRSQFNRIRNILNQAITKLFDGLLPSPTGPAYWHFYDWTEGGLDGTVEGDATWFAVLEHRRFDAPLNAFFIFALEAGLHMAEALNEQSTAAVWKQQLQETRTRYHQRFFDPLRHTYRTFESDGATNSRPSELVQALSLCAQCCPPEVATPLRAQLLGPDQDWIASTLSQSLYTFEALAQDPQWIGPMLERVNRTWGKMIAQGATTFWETLDGSRAFGGAGSLCHGWSAIPAYLYGAYLLGVRPLKPGFEAFTHSPLRPGETYGVVPTPQGTIHVS